MGKTNWKRVFLGGLVAGIVLEILFVVAALTYIKSVWDPAVLALMPDYKDTTGLQVFWAYLNIVTGILAVWLYSAIRPRYGAGPKTALIAGLFVWTLCPLSFDLTVFALGLFPANVVAIDSLTNLVMYVVATLAGAWVYKEQE